MSGAMTPPPGPPGLMPGGPMGGPSLPPAGPLAALGRMMPQGGAASLPGLGAQADGLAQLKNIVGMLQGVLPKFEAGSEVHKAALKAVTDLSRHVPSGAEAQGVQISQLRDMIAQSMRNAMLARVLQNGGGAAPAPAIAPATAPAGA